MSRFSDRESIKFGPWPFGSNNLAREDSLPPGHLRFAKNADIYPSGKARERPGYALVDPTAAGGDGFWSNGSIALYRKGADLYQFSPRVGSTLLFSGLYPFSRMVYEEVDQSIFISDSVETWKLDPYSLEVTPWGVAAPGWQGTATASVDGGLNAGVVQTAITYMTDTGEESGTPLAAATAIGQYGGVQLTNIPQPVQSNVTTVNIYATPPNGEQLRWHGRVPVGTTSYLVDVRKLGRELKSQFYQRMPAGQAAAYYNGTLFVANRSLVVWSPALWYGQWDTAFNYLDFGADVDLVIAAGPKSGGGGVYVCAGRKTYFLPGASPKDFRQVDVGYGAVAGSGAHVAGDTFKIQGLPSYELPVWIDRDGFFTLGLADGNLIRPTSGRYAMSVGDYASTLIRSLRGVNQYVATMEGPTVASRAAFTDAAEMTLIRRVDSPC